MTNIKDNIYAVEQQIKQACQQYSRSAQEITLLAVSKTKPCSAIAEAYQAGQRHFGENYLQEALEKIEALRHLSDICWHFIGPLQSNKTKAIAENFSWVHSVDRAKIASRLNEQRQGAPLNVCIQVNIDDEASKSGISPEELPALAETISQCPNLCLRGLMAIPKPQAEAASYQKMQRLFLDLQQRYPTMDTLSIGMSNDLQPAIAAGSTMVRIGTAIFGTRNTNKESL